MPHISPPHSLALTAGLVIFLSFTGGALAAGATADGAGTHSVAPVQNGASQIHITLTGNDGGACTLDHNTAKAGPVSFAVTNKTATGITEVELLSGKRMLGEKENLAPGLPTVRFTVTLDGGRYQIYCPGAQQEMIDFEVTGKVASRPAGDAATLLAAGAKDYAHYVSDTVNAMVAAVGRLKAAIDAGDLAKARAEYPQARVFYERIESDVEGFMLPGHDVTDNTGNLDYLVDMRASNLDPKVGWHGFHAIERDLFGKGEITAGTRTLAAELQNNVKKLDALSKTLDYRPEDLANGAAGLLEEVLTSKITGEEESFSHYDLVDFAANVEGAQQAFSFLKPGLEKIAPDLTRRVTVQFARVNALLDTYRDQNEPGGYQRYTPELRASDGARLSRAIQALQEPFSRVAEKVASAG